VRIPTAIAVVSVMAIGGAAPASRSGTGVIAGSLVAADTGRPVRFARVSLTGAASSTLTAVSDNQGGFSFAELAAGSYTLSASKPGFLSVQYGEKTPGRGRAGTPIPLAGEYTLLARVHKTATMGTAGSRITVGMSGDVRWAMEPLTIAGANVSDLVLSLQRGLSVSGSIVCEGAAPPTLSSHAVVTFHARGAIGRAGRSRGHAVGADRRDGSVHRDRSRARPVSRDADAASCRLDARVRDVRRPRRA